MQLLVFVQAVTLVDLVPISSRFHIVSFILVQIFI